MRLSLNTLLERERKSLYKNRHLLILFVIPFLHLLIFKYGPMFGMVLAFKDYSPLKGIWGSAWVGLQHFGDIFTANVKDSSFLDIVTLKAFFKDVWFYQTIKNTVILSIVVLVFYFPIPIILALLINEVRSLGYKKFVQTVSYLPHFFSTVVVIGLIVNMLASDGLLNQFLAKIDVAPLALMLNPKAFRPLYTLSMTWQGMGWGSILYLAALTGIDPGLYEAAHLDGANRIQRAIYISIPGILPLISIMLILSVGDIISVGFERAFLLQNDATMELADVIQTYVYRRGIVKGDFSYGAAIDLLSGVISLVLVVLANNISRRLSDNSIW